MKILFLTILFLVMTFSGSFGCYALKRSSAAGLAIKSLLLNKYFYLGGGSYFLSAILNIILLKHLQYAIVLPLTSITYIWSMFLAYVFLKERITKEKIIGMALIITGVPFLFVN